MESLALYTAIRQYEWAIRLDRILPARYRRYVFRLLGLVVAGALFLVIAGHAGEKTVGIALISSALWLVASVLECFYFSWVYRLSAVTFDVATVLYPEVRDFHAAHGGVLHKTHDCTRHFLETSQGLWIFARAGISLSDTKSYYKSRAVTAQTFADVARILNEKTNTGARIGMADVMAALLATDADLLHFVVSHGVEKDDVVYAAQWFDERQATFLWARRFWSREALARVEGLGAEWTYGRTFILSKYAADITAGGRTSLGNASFGSRDVVALERTLSKSHESNALLVGDRGEGVLDLLYALAKKIQDGKVFPELAHRRVFMFDAKAFSVAHQTKALYEPEMLALLREAARAGNIILVFPDFPRLVADARALQVDVAALLDPYLANSDILFVAVADPAVYHEVLEPQSALMERFDKILLEKITGAALDRYLATQAEKYEAKTDLFFTAGALRAISTSTTRYFGGAAGLDTVEDILSELVPAARAKGAHMITREVVMSVVEERTGVPLGALTAPEKSTLLNLEKDLHRRVIGQEEAVASIANAMRRARAGITNPNRPIGSFLFLGPTGVGKTETAKALAAAYFKDESAMLRLDMTEFTGQDALARLIGSDAGSGILANMLRDKQFGVLLLDEFEKASRAVHDLFLQIFDEGFFSDFSGKKVYARSLILIATSNAGSQTMRQYEQQGIALEAKKDEIIESLMSGGLFRPELLNRFDGVILFHSLTDTELEQVARLMLGKLNKRLMERGIELAITNDLVAYLVKKGGDQHFGARSMNRAIQETIEHAIALKLIDGSAQPGSKIELSTETFR